MSPRKLLLLICLTLGSCLVVEDFANAQRGGRSSGGGRSTGSSAGRSSGGRSMGSSRSSGRSMGSSRSSGRSLGSSRSTGSTSPIRSSTSRTTRSPLAPSTSTTRGLTPSTSTSRTTRTSPSTDLGRSSSSTSRISPGIGSSTSSSRPLDSASAIERLTGRGSSSATPTAPRTGLGGSRTAPPTSPYDLSRRVSTFDSTPGAREQGLDQATVRVPARTSARTTRSSTVPQPYSDGVSRRSSNLPSTSRRAALAERLRAATSIGSDSGVGTRSLADRYSPSTNERSSLSTRLGDGRRSSRAREQAAAGATQPGKARLEALGRSASSAERAASARGQALDQRAQNGRAQRTEADQAQAQKRVQNARQQYRDAVAQDEALEKRMSNASRSAAIAGDIAVRGALAANPLTGAYGGYYGNGNPWGGYANGGWCNWYWNSCFPYWNNWWWGGCGFGFGFGWGWGGSFGWGYNPCWSWPCYYPSWGWNAWWPTYAYWTPAVVYSYVEVPVYTTVAQAPAETLVEPAATVERAPDFGKRAATEYMALGDRAFTEGRYGDAVHYYAKAIDYSPSDGVLYLVLSDALFATGDYHYAAFALRRSLELSPELASLGLDKRTFYGIPTDFDKQLAVLERFVLDHPIDDDARLMLSANYLFSLQAEKSVQLLDEQYSLALRQSTGGQLIYAASAAMLAGKN